MRSSATSSSAASRGASATTNGSCSGTAASRRATWPWVRFSTRGRARGPLAGRTGGWSRGVPGRRRGAGGGVMRLAHPCQTFAGGGFVRGAGERGPAAEARGFSPYEPGLKEGVALGNGAPFAAPLAIHLVDRARPLLEHATVAAALAAALTGASSRPFSTRIGRLKGDLGQLRVHERLVELLCDWSDRPQAPVSLRVVPQVHGAVLDVLDGMEAQLEREVRAVTDSPLSLPAAGGEPEGFY